MIKLNRLYTPIKLTPAFVRKKTDQYKTTEKKRLGHRLAQR